MMVRVGILKWSELEMVRVDPTRLEGPRQFHKITVSDYVVIIMATL